MEQQIFCDGIGRISIIGGIVRLDLMTYSATESDANGQPRAVLSHRIAMSVDGFLRSSEKILEITQQITRQQQPARPATPPAQPAPREAPQQVRPAAQTPAASPPPPKRPFP